MSDADQRPGLGRSGASTVDGHPDRDEGDLDMTAPREDDKDASLDRLALDRLEFDIRAWWARNRHLHDQVLLERDGRRDERGLELPRPRVPSKE